MNDMYLVSCVRMKFSRPAEAQDLYQSHWFVKARKYVESRDARWYILSAKYGLVRPDRQIEPYDLSLGELCAPQRRQWAHRIVNALANELARHQNVVIFAGARYREFLVPGLVSRSISVSIPMTGMPIGRQMHWLNENTPKTPAQASDI